MHRALCVLLEREVHPFTALTDHCVNATTSDSLDPGMLDFGKLDVGSQKMLVQQMFMAQNNPVRTPVADGMESDGRSSTSSTRNGHSESTAGDWVSEQSNSISNNTPSMLLKCSECGLAKNSSEELEVHIKQEHLQWLPFQCPICLSERASDAQMREHIYSAHKKNMNKFIYVDNVQAKRTLQQQMDRSFHLAMSLNSANNSSNTTNSANRRGPLGPLNGRSNGAMLNTLANQLMANHTKEQDKTKELVSVNFNGTSDTTAARSHSPREAPASRKREHDQPITSGSSNTDALLAQINAQANLNTEDDYDVDDPQEAFAMMFSPKRAKHDLSQDDDEVKMPAFEDDFGDASAMLESLFGGTPLTGDVPASEDFHVNPKYGKHMPLMTKKRVLGECSKCQKPVTAGARQMHMFYHLGKDHGIFRFRCRFDHCNVEHYRKDQMENHHSKVHGRIDPEMMEDRSLELYQRCQEMSMELIGTDNCTPGPTADRAQIAYEAQLAEQKRRADRPRRKEGHDSTWQNKAIPDDERPLECRKCNKTMQNRIRGFHILWHLAKDLNINRYICKICNFGHDRSQSVQTHGKREHGTDDVVLDKIDDYEEEIKQMSEQCFGFQALFSQESRRRSKIPLAPRADDNNSPPVDEEDDTKGDIDSMIADDDEDEVPTRPKPVRAEIKPSSASRPSRRHISHRRFGTRRAMGKNKRLEMARLREVSMRLGGAQYFKKRVNEVACCGACGLNLHTRLSEHAYKHLNVPLFLCPHCDLGNHSRDTVVKHMKEMHDDVNTGSPIDQRLKYAQEIKDMIAHCYPGFFVDAPIPTPADIEKLQAPFGDDDTKPQIAIDHDGDHDEEDDSDADDQSEHTEEDAPELADQTTERSESPPNSELTEE
ncbi:unnamed protein product, partial [Mesorhabditis spiculigera]